MTFVVRGSREKQEILSQSRHLLALRLRVTSVEGIVRCIFVPKMNFLCVASLLLGSLGCGADHGGRQAISGSVKLRDDAIQKGTVEFTSFSSAYQNECA